MKRIQLENRSDLKSEIPLEAPYSIFIDPSSACNFKCKFCMNHKITRPQIMDYPLYQKIIDDLQEFENPVKVIRLYGFGEPLLNPKFTDMVRYAKASDKVLSVDTTTNASVLTPAYNEDMVDSGIDRINISIEGLSSEEYFDFTGAKVDFNRLVQNITHLYSLKKDMIIFIKINGDKLTDNQKKTFYDIFTPISDGCNIEYSMNCWYGVETEKHPELGVYGQPREDVKICPYVFYSFMIQSSGAASLCFLDWDQKMIIGDARHQTVKEIWDSPAFHKIRIDMLTGQKHPICASCDQLKAGMPVNLDDYAVKILERINR
jgi:MoaA/NifB/PqqE/SkfB family radical SAM enzyme